jgi:TonB family protein
LVSATLQTALDGAAIATVTQSLPHVRIMDLLSPAGLDAEAVHTEPAGANGVNLPACIYCPIPEYSEKGRKAGIPSAHIILSVTISTAGNPIKIGVVTDAGYGFTEKAIEIVSEWKFRPAAGKDGTPVPVAVPVEIRFSST